MTPRLTIKTPLALLCSIFFIVGTASAAFEELPGESDGEEQTEQVAEGDEDRGEGDDGEDVVDGGQGEQIDDDVQEALDASQAAYERDTEGYSSDQTIIGERANVTSSQEDCAQLNEQYAPPNNEVSYRIYNNFGTGSTVAYANYEWNPESCAFVYTSQRRDRGCFAPETEILMGDKTTKKIADIREGDFVWNPVAGKSQKVAKMISGPEKLPLVEVGFGSTLVRVTQTHPMVVSADRTGLSTVALRSDSATQTKIIKANEITESDLILGADGEFHKVSVLREIPSEKNQKVYNLELESDSDKSSEHMVVGNGIVTGDIRLQAKLNGYKLSWGK